MPSRGALAPVSLVLAALGGGCGSGGSGSPDATVVDASIIDAEVDAPIDAPTDAAIDAEPGCGDGVHQAGEQCDDGNRTSGDGCSPTCQLEGNFAAETEANGTLGLANPLPAGADGFLAAIEPVADHDCFSFAATVPGSSVWLAIHDGLGHCPDFASHLDLYSPGSTVLVSDDHSGAPPSCSQLTPDNAPATIAVPVGTYRACVRHATDGAPQAQYVLAIRVKPPGCGDLVRQATEQCDDGNLVGGDGCAADCTAQAPGEREPNDSAPAATPPWPGVSHWTGAIVPFGDRDYFQVVKPSAGGLTLTTHAAGDAASCGFDTVLHLLDRNGAEVARDDDGGPGACSLISPATHPAVQNLPAGTYYAWVERSGGAGTIARYQLDLALP